MNKNKKEYLKPSVLVVLLQSQGNLLTPSLNTYDANDPYISDEDEEITDSEQIW